MDGGPSQFRRFIHGRVAAVANGGRYALTASFMRGGNAIARTDMAKHLRFQVYQAGSTSPLRTFSFEAHWSAVDERSTYIDHHRGIEATFHPTLPIMAWTFSWFGSGFWLADFREDSRPIFIEGRPPLPFYATLLLTAVVKHRTPLIVVFSFVFSMWKILLGAQDRCFDTTRPREWNQMRLFLERRVDPRL